jgi:lipoyl(octanoyl) transferase
MIKLFNKEFEIIKHSYEDGQFNMDFDLERTVLCSKNEALPMFRFYGWKPWTVSLGYNQKDENIDRKKLVEKGFNLVRRPTGGRAVLHANELTYSVVVNLTNGITIHDAYGIIHNIILEGLKKIDAKDIDFEKSGTDLRDFYKKQTDMSVSCFASSARYEIAYKARKVVGSAQRLFGRTLLQHGSILLSEGHEQLADITITDSEEKRKILREYIISHSATVSQSCGRQIGFNECMNSIVSVLEDQNS